MDEFINIWALVLFTWGFPRRKIWDFTVMNNNSSLTGYLHFLVVPCTVLLFLEATVNMDFCNKTNIFCPFILRLNQIGKPLISKIPLSCYNPTSQTWLIKGTKFSTELLSIHPFSVVLFQNEKFTLKGWVELDHVAGREQQQCFSGHKGQRDCLSIAAIKLPENWSCYPSLSCCLSDGLNWGTVDRKRGVKELPCILSSENQHKLLNLILI